MSKYFSIIALCVFALTVRANTDAVHLNDAQIKKVLLTLNEGEIEAAKLANQRAQDESVKSLAKMMVDEHKENIKETKEVAKNNKIGTRDSKLSKDLKKDAFQVTKSLRGAEQGAFDKAYVSSQISMHQKALDMLNNTLIPNASNPAFKTHLEKTRDAVQAHLEHAQSLQAKM